VEARFVFLLFLTQASGMFVFFGSGMEATVLSTAAAILFLFGTFPDNYSGLQVVYLQEIKDLEIPVPIECS
jgi:hypothetical protein